MPDGLVTKPGNTVKPKLTSSGRTGWKAIRKQSLPKIHWQTEGLYWVRFSRYLSYIWYNSIFSLTRQINRLRVQVLNSQMTPAWNEPQAHQRKDCNSKWFWQIGKWPEKAECVADRMKAKFSASVVIINCVSAGSTARAWPRGMWTS